MSKHTPGAMRAAKIIMNGREFINTEYGKKRLEGIADLVDRETAAPAMYEALHALINGPGLCGPENGVKKA